MFRIALQLKKQGENILILKLPPFIKAGSILFIIFLIVSMFMFPLKEGERGLDAITIFFIVISIFIILYEEKWIFNKNSNTLESRLGLIFHYSKQIVSIDTIKCINVTEVKKGKKRPTTYLKVTLLFKDETEKDIELVHIREKIKLKKNTQIIAEFCSVPVYYK